MGERENDLEDALGNSGGKARAPGRPSVESTFIWLEILNRTDTARVPVPAGSLNRAFGAATISGILTSPKRRREDARSRIL